MVEPLTLNFRVFMEKLVGAKTLKLYGATVEGK